MKLDTKSDYILSKDAGIKDILESLDRLGVLILPEYLDAAQVEQLKGEFAKFFEEKQEWIRPMKYPAGRAVSVKRKRMDKNLFPLTAEIFSSKFMAQITDFYLGKPNQLNTEIFVTHDLPSPKSINEMHFDKLRTLKFFIYLKDTTAANGAFDAVPGSHLLGKKIADRHTRWGGRIKDIPNFRLPKTLGEAVPIEGPAGSMIIFTTDVFHRGGFVSDGLERMVMRGHCRADPPPTYDPKKYSRQWWRESPYNPMRYIAPLAGVDVKPHAGSADMH